LCDEKIIEKIQEIVENSASMQEALELLQALKRDNQNLIIENENFRNILDIRN